MKKMNFQKALKRIKRITEYEACAQAVLPDGGYRSRNHSHLETIYIAGKHISITFLTSENI